MIMTPAKMTVVWRPRGNLRDEIPSKRSLPTPGQAKIDLNHD